MADEGRADDSAALVFVYGTLRRGQPNHAQLRGCASQGEAELSGLALYDLGPFPMAVPADGPTDRLQGELYQVNAEQLARLDRFEGAPRLYERQRWPLADGRPVWVYVGRPQQVRHVRRISSGRWRGRGLSAAVALSTALSTALDLALLPGAGQADDLRAQCLAWSAATGRERVQLANRIGQEQLLTKTHRLAEASAEDAVSLYSWGDIQRLCRRQ